jgi:hydroxymethylpyrimidine pyrophosphatase-like HAD family hydrolase
LIAADIDKTLIQQEPGEREEFLADVGPQLVAAARLGTNLAFLTGNSMNELCTRLLSWLLEQLCPDRGPHRLNLLSKFHVFTNGGAVYARFPEEELPKLEALLAAHDGGDRYCRVLNMLTEERGTLGRVIRPRYLVGEHIERARIEDGEERRILHILEAELKRYAADICQNADVYAADYDLSTVCEGTQALAAIDRRRVGYEHHGVVKEASVQITVKPVLSFRHAYEPTKMINSDVRSNVTEKIQRRLDRDGLGHYVARPGGRSSIDVAPEKVDKAYALERLIDHLNIQGTIRRNQHTGSNTIYLGDEVIAGYGNDYAVTRIPGLLVFAVNSDRELVPFLSHVLVPSAVLEGPDAVADVLTDYNRIAFRLLRRFDSRSSHPQDVDTALDVLKAEVLLKRIGKKLGALGESTHLSPEDLQTLHAFVTLMCRNDRPAREWLSMLMNHLDAIMSHLAMPLAAQGAMVPPAIGTSYDEK